MEAHLPPAVETPLQQVACASEKDAEQLVMETVNRMLEDRTRFISAVQHGIEQADRGELVEHSDVRKRINKVMKHFTPILTLFAFAAPVFAQAQPNGEFRLAFPNYHGQIKWSAEGFQTIETSAKPNGQEFGVRGRDPSGRLTFLGFLFVVPGTVSMSSEGCRDDAISQDKKNNASLKVLKITDLSQAGRLAVALVTYSTPTRDGSLSYMVRGFVASGDICGDLEFYSSNRFLAMIRI